MKTMLRSFVKGKILLLLALMPANSEEDIFSKRDFMISWCDNVFYCSPANPIR